MYNFRLDSWNIAIRQCETGTILSDYITPFNVIPNGRYLWAADPFLFVYEYQLYVFAEVYDYRVGRGGIAYAVYDEERHIINEWKFCIIEKYHMSFPFIYEENGEIYLMPETNSGYCLNRYRAEQFPDKWEKEELISDVRLSDTAIFNIDGEKWIYSLRKDLNNSDKQWAAIYKYDKNIILNDDIYSTDMESCRLGGAFFKLDGKLVKVAQDCSKTYGGGLVFQEFSKSNDLFQEKTIKKIYPSDLRFDSNIQAYGIHTYNSCSGYEVIDIKTKRLSLIQRYYNFKRKLN